MLVAAGAIVLMGQPVQGAGNTYYVSPTGSDSSNGSSAAPFRQIRKALAVVRPGDTVLVADGSYLGFNADNLLGTAAASITIKAQGKGVQVTPTTDRSDNRDNISVNNSAYLVFDGINSSNASRAGIRINTSNGVTVRNGVYGNNGYWGIFTGHSDDLLLEYNECFGSQVQHGIYTSNSGDRPIVRFNRLHDNANCGLHMNGDVSEPGDGLISGALVEGNVIYNNGATGGSAINMDGVQDSVIRNNLLYNNHGHGIDGYQIDAAQGPKGLKILNNTVSMASNGSWAIQLTETAGVNVVRNNILYHPNTSRGGILAGGNADMANLDSDYNMLDRANPDDGAAITLAQWKALGQDAHSTAIGSKVLFVNAAGGDFHLAAGSAAIDKGATLAEVTQDLDKNPRPSGAAYDIGAYEEQTSTTQSPPAAPTNLRATAGTGQVSLTWSASTGATAYQVERQDPGAAFARIALVSGTSYTDTGLQGNTTYVYRVNASNSGGTSGYSATASATTPATTYTISGKVTVGGSGVGGVQVAGGAWTTYTAADGTYSLSGFPAGNYGIYAKTPSYSFAPQSAMVGPSKTGVDFSAPAGTDIGQGSSTYTISGRVTVGGSGVSGVRVSGGADSVLTAADGSYTLRGFPSGNFAIYANTPSYSFAPQSAMVGPSKTGVDFSAPAGTDIGQGTSYTISGKVTVGGVGVGGVNVAGGAGSTVTAADGSYTLTGFSAGNYGVYATKAGYSFPPQSVSLGPSRTGVDFAGSAN